MHKKYTLKNGLRVVLVPRESSDTMTLMMLVRTGSADESDEIAGVSHLLEHMLWMGTKKRPTSLAVADFIESVGGQDNAFTSKIYTGYYVKVSRDFWAEAIDFISDNFLHALMLEDKIEREKKVIIEEIKLHDDIPADFVVNLFDRAAYGQTPLGRDISGTKESVLRLDKDQIMQYHSERYAASNCVLAVAGKWGASDEKLIAEIESSFQFESKAKEAFQLPVYEIKPEYVSVQRKSTEQSKLLIGFKAPVFGDDDWYAMSLLAKILGGGASSRMFQDIREKRGLAYDVRSGISSYLSAGEIGTMAGVANEKWLKASEAIVDQYRIIRDGGVTPQELQRAKNMVKGELLIEMEDSQELAWQFGEYELLYNKIITPEEILQSYQKVEARDIEQVAAKYFNFDQVLYAAVGTEVEEDKIRKTLKL